MLDLKGASRDDLIRVVLGQRERIADLEQQVARLHAEIATLQTTVAHLTQQLGAALTAEPAPAAPAASPPSSPARSRPVPGTKPTERPDRPKKPRKRRAHGFGRRRMTPTTRQVHAVERCPTCGVRLTGGSVKRTREVIEVPVVPVTVTEHVYVERQCPCCRQRWVPPAALDGLVDGQQRLGVGLVSLIATLREELRLPIERIQWYLATLYGVALSVGAIVDALRRVAARGQAVVEQILARIRGSPVVHADETGWREDGVNGYAWTISTPTERYFVRGRRERAVLEAALGDDFGGLLVSDFYVAYTTYDGRHQYCWTHLLRDIHDLRVAHPRDAGVQGWAEAVHQLYLRARQDPARTPAERTAAQRRYEDELRTLCEPYEKHPTAPQAVLCRRILAHLPELFVFVADPRVPSDNNAAERSLRHLVTCRKISGGTRSADGTNTKMTLATVFGTWRAQGLNPFLECRRLLASPQL
jgi:transposase